MPDPLDILRLPDAPVAPDPAFAADLRRRLAQALGSDRDTDQTRRDTGQTDRLTNQSRRVTDQSDRFTDQEDTMTDTPTTHAVSTDSRRAGLSRNGSRHGDISYISLGVPDTDRAQAFYNAVLGWSVTPGRPEYHGRQVEEVIPQIGLWSGPQLLGHVIHGAVLAFRVDDLARAIEVVREQGGIASDIRPEPYGLTADCRDNQGMDFYLHQLPPTGEPAGANGVAPGDVSYLSLIVADAGRAQAFYGAVLGWNFSPTGRPDGWNVDGPSPMVGLAGREDDVPQAVLSYVVDDLSQAVARVRDAGGSSTDPIERPYGLEASCTDDQGLAFYLHQFAEG